MSSLVARFGALSFVVGMLAACNGSGPGITIPNPPKPDTAPPPIMREMRGLWIATVANIDWPSRNNLTADQQRAELTDLIDRAASAGFNAVLFAVRPEGDVVYSSWMGGCGAAVTGARRRG